MSSLADRPVRVLGIAGSLRRHSLNKALLASARDLSPPGLEKLRALTLRLTDGLRAAEPVSSPPP